MPNVSCQVHPHMKLIVGLGNPGKEYEKTRHNAGFLVVDTLASLANLSWKSGFKGEVAKGKIGGEDVVLLKPHTYMNLSGDAVIEALNFYKLDAKESLWVVHDELDLPVGALRISVGASPGGHNGVKSVLSHAGTQDFARFRLGIGRPEGQIPVEDYVLQSFRLEEEPAARETVEKAAKAIEAALKEGLTAAMNKYNG